MMYSTGQNGIQNRYKNMVRAENYGTDPKHIEHTKRARATDRHIWHTPTIYVGRDRHGTYQAVHTKSGVRRPKTNGTYQTAGIV